MENMGKMVKDSVEASIVGKTVEDRAINYDAFFDHLDPYYKNGGVESVCRKLFDMINIEPKFVQESNPEFKEMRQKLHTEGGIVIANHPMPPLDVFSVIQSMALSEEEKAEGKTERTDCKILVPDEYVEVYRKHFGSENWVSTEELKTLSGFRDILEHINSGGLFIIFPTGLHEETEKKIQFQDGFASILKRIDKEKMVYSFSVDYNDIETIRKEHPALLLGVFAEARTAFGEAGNLNDRRPKEFFKVDENYSTASQWQETIAAHDKDDVNEALTDLYLSKFVKNDENEAKK